MLRKGGYIEIYRVRGVSLEGGKEVCGRKDLWKNRF